jgi:hypothetical protein
MPTTLSAMLSISTIHRLSLQRLQPLDDGQLR